MKTALKIIVLSTALVTTVAAIVLGCVYIEDITKAIGKIKYKLTGRTHIKKKDVIDGEISEQSV